MDRKSTSEFVIKTAKGTFNIPSSTVTGINRLQIDTFFVDVRHVSMNHVDTVERLTFFVSDSDVFSIAHVENCVGQATQTEEFGLIFLGTFNDSATGSWENNIGIAKGAKVEPYFFIIADCKGLM